MVLPMDLSQVLAVDVSIYLRGGNIRVAEHFLDRPKVCSSFEQVRRERVTQRVR
jgi:hypothetical protein